MTYTTISACRVCGSEQLESLFSLGEQYVSNFVDREHVHDGPKCPIELVLCRQCTLVQQRHTAPQEFLYTRHYWYRSGVTDSMKAALKDVAQAAERVVGLQPGDVVLDIGSNDGTLLRCFSDNLFRVGVEPADNLATQENYEFANHGMDLIHDFWSAKAFEQWHHNYTSNCDYGGEVECECPPRKAKIVTALGMFYDLEDPNAFIADVAKVLRPDGVFIAQLMCLKQMVDIGDVGNLCHEHLEFYSLRSLLELYGRHGLQIFNIEENKVNGGSYRIYARLVSSGKPGLPESLLDAMNAETLMGLDRPEFYADWFARLQKNREAVRNFIADEVDKGKKVWVYGASTKGNVILQWLGIPSAWLAAAADRSPEKHGKYTVGTGIPIVSEEEFRKAKPDYALVLPYCFRAEFLEREKAWCEAGGRFIFPLPKFEVV